MLSMSQNGESKPTVTWWAWCEGCGQRSDILLAREDAMMFLMEHWSGCKGNLKRGRVYERVPLPGGESDLLHAVYGEALDLPSEWH